MSVPSGKEPEFSEELLGSLLRFDEMLRRGSITTEEHGQPAPDDGIDPQLAETLFLAKQAIRTLAATAPRHTDSVPSWAPKSIGRFEIQSVLGVGGFAIVYLAWDPRLSRFVALKIPRPHSLFDQKLRQQFIKEGQTAASLDHQGIVKVLEAGEDGDVPFIACTWCEGPTLAKWISERTTPVQPAIAARIILRLAQAVQYSHERNVLHLDIKPGNILLFPQSPPESELFPYAPRLSDFGLAKVMEQSQSESLSGSMIGTPQYMAPEQFGGRSHRIGVATDVYALGAVLYCLVTGHPPFGAATIPETLRQIEEQDAFPPHIINPHIQKDLSWVILKCLEKDPLLRYATAVALAEDLSRFIEGRTVKARRTAIIVRIQKWFRRKPMVASLSAVAGLLLCLLLFLWLQYVNSVHQLHTELSQKQSELAAAEAKSNAALGIALSNRQQAESLLYSANVLSAGIALRRSDPSEAALILKPWIEGERKSSEVRKEFAARYIWNQLRKSSRLIDRTGFAIWDLAVSPDQSVLAVTGNKGTVKLYHTHQNFAPIGEMTAVSSEINCLSYSDEGRLLAGGTDSGQVILWSTSDRSIIRSMTIPEIRQIYGVEFIPGSHRLVVAGQSKDLTILNADSGVVDSVIPNVQSRTVEAIAVSRDGQQIAAVGNDGQLVLIPVANPSEQRVLFDFEPTVIVVQFSPDGKYIFTGDSGGYVRACNTKTGSILAEARRLDGIQGLAVSSDGKVIFGEKRGTLSEFSPPPLNSVAPQTWIPTRVWSTNDATVNAIVPAQLDIENQHEEKLWISSDRNGTLSLWIREEGSHRIEIPASSEIGPRGGLHGLAAGPGEGEFYRLNGGKIELCNVDGRITRHSLNVEDVITCFAGDSRRLRVVGTHHGELLRLGVDGKTVAARYRVVDSESVYQIYYDPYSDLLLTQIAHEDELCWVDLRHGRVELPLLNRSASSISAAGGYAVTARHGTNDLQVFSLKTRKPIAAIAAHKNTIYQLVSAHTQPWLVSISGDRTAKLWETGSWKLLRTFSGHLYPVVCCAMSPDEQTLATGDEWGTIKLWHLHNGRELIELPSLDQPVASLLFSEGGRYLYAISFDGTVTAFDAGDPGASDPRVGTPAP
ncbi:MAG: protein kinase [Planctomyces sp.]|nr:protein kinase [Planctomyces sp.]